MKMMLEPGDGLGWQLGLVDCRVDTKRVRGGRGGKVFSELKEKK